MEGSFLNNTFLKNKKIVLGILGFLGVIIVISVIVILYQNHLRKLEIVEVKNYPTALPENMRDNLEIQLRRLLENNFGAPSDVLIEANAREGTYSEDQSDDTTTATFLVDIDEYKQTYEVMMSWSDKMIVPDAVLISCPSKRLMKYSEAKCIAMYNNSQDLENMEKNPIYEKLPIVVDYFDYYSRKAIRYEVRGYFGENNELILTVVDYSGGNLENAKKKVRELGYDPDNYKIKYVDQSGNF
ncbi:hypothetical protein IJJ05_03355 [Candidatus Saccharibacteria bacterium]|nr:hypothetical protein [Candidatus Saccharibacteria bacterium]